jgi:hypothetical protein
MVSTYLALDNPKLHHIAAQGPLCPCATNALINVRQCRRFAHSALKPCGLLEQRRDLATCPSFIPLNAELAACRTSSQRERDHSRPSGLWCQVFFSTIRDAFLNFFEKAAFGYFGCAAIARPLQDSRRPTS